MMNKEFYKMQKFKELLEQDYNDEEYEAMNDKYDDLVVDLVEMLSDNIEILNEDIQEKLFELTDLIAELFDYDSDSDEEDYDNDNNNDYEEDTVAGDVGQYVPPLFTLKRKNDNIYEKVEDEELDDLDEAAKRIKRNRALKLKRSRIYKRNRAKIKLAQKRFRKTSKFKRYKKKAKRMAKRGKTASGRRQRKFF